MRCLKLFVQILPHNFTGKSVLYKKFLKSQRATRLEDCNFGGQMGGWVIGYRLTCQDSLVQDPDHNQDFAAKTKTKTLTTTDQDRDQDFETES